MTTENAATPLADTITQVDHQNEFEVLPVAHDQESLARQFANQADDLRRNAFRVSLSPLNDAAAPIPKSTLNLIHNFDILGHAPLTITQAHNDLNQTEIPGWQLNAAKKLLTLNQTLTILSKEEAGILVGDDLNWAELSLKAADVLAANHNKVGHDRMLMALGHYYDVTAELDALKLAVQQRISARLNLSN